MQPTEQTQPAALTVVHLLLLAALGWITLSYDTDARPNYDFRLLGLLWTLSFPTMLIAAGQFMVRHDRKLFAWSYSVLLPGLLATALLCGSLLLKAATPTASGLVVAAETAAFYQREALYRLNLEVGMARNVLTYGLSFTSLLAVLLVSRWANKRRGVVRLGAWLPQKQQVVLVCLLFSLGAAAQLFIYWNALRHMVAGYQLELYKHPAGAGGDEEIKPTSVRLTPAN